MTVQVPTLIIVLPVLVVVAVACSVTATWAWHRHLDPMFYRWMYRRYCGSLQRIGADAPTFEAFCDQFEIRSGGKGRDLR